MSLAAGIEQIERKMAELQAQIEAVNAAVAPHRAELDVLLAEEQALKARIAAKVAELNAARGDGQAFLAMKKQLGMLASTRMQMREALKAL